MERFLLWMENVHPWIIFTNLVVIFVLLSFPFIFGYSIFVVACGYIYGFPRGMLFVVTSVAIGVMIAHFTIRTIRKWLNFDRLFVNNETVIIIMNVISGPQAFKIVFLARIAPVPFGLQNAFFALSNVKTHIYLPATYLGLAPTQCIKVYIGSTLRSMEKVIGSSQNKTLFWTIAVQVVLGIGFLIWLALVAKNELQKAIVQSRSAREANEPQTIEI